MAADSRGNQRKDTAGLLATASLAFTASALHPNAHVRSYAHDDEQARSLLIQIVGLHQMHLGEAPFVGTENGNYIVRFANGSILSVIPSLGPKSFALGRAETWTMLYRDEGMA